MDCGRTTRHPLRQAATGGEACYFLGTDSALHPVAKKLATPPAEVKVAGEDERALIHHGGERLEWQVVS